MKKIKLLLVFCLIFLMESVLAANISVSLSCPSSVYAGEKITCKVNSNTSDGLLSGIKANYEIINGSYVSFANGGSWIPYATTNSGFVLGNTSGGVTNSSLLGSLIVSPTGGVGTTVTIKLNSINASDTDYNDYDIGSKSAVVNVIEKVQVQEPQPEKKDPVIKKEEVYLDSLTVEGYTLFFSKNVYEYELEVEASVTSVNVKASSKYNKVTGAGNLQLNSNENIFKIVVTGKESSKTYTLKVRKAEVVNDVVINDAKQVEKSLNKYDLVTINLKKGTDELVAYQNVLDKVKGQNKKIVYNIYNNENLTHSFTFDGSNMDFILDNMNLEITFDSNKAKELGIDKESLILDMSYKSYFPKGTTLKIYDVKKNNKEKIKMYRVNAEDNLELVKSNVSFANKEITIELEKGDLYVLSNTNIQTDYFSILIVQSIVIVLVLLESVYVTYKYVKLKGTY